MRATRAMAGCRRKNHLLQRLGSRNDAVRGDKEAIVSGLTGLNGRSGETYEICVCWENSGGEEAHCTNKGESRGMEATAGNGC